MQALLGFTSEARWLRHARAHLRHLFPYLPQQPGYNKRLRAAASLIRHCIRVLAADTSVWTDDVWVVDSTPVECGRSRRPPNARTWPGGPSTATAPAIPATSGGCGLHLVCTLQGLPVGFALTGAKADEREVLRHAHRRPDLLASPARPDPHRRQELLRRRLRGRHRQRGDQAAAARPQRRAPNGQARACSSPCARSSNRSTTPSKANSTWNNTAATHPGGVIVRVLQRILALTAAIWHNDPTGQPVLRSLMAYDH